MTDDKHAALRETLEREMPQSVDDIVRENRDTLCMALAVDSDLDAIPVDVGPRGPTDIIDGWYMVTLHERLDEADRVSVHLLGWSRTRMTSWVTSRVVALDRGRNQVLTRSGTRY